MSDWGGIDGRALDRYITGNWGEDGVEDDECEEQPKPVPCSECGGEGFVADPPEQGGEYPRFKKCPLCNGTGKLD